MSASVTQRERALRLTLQVTAWLAGLGLFAMIAIALWARSALTPVEGIVALQSRMFASGEGLYYDLNRYPFTVAAYGPIYYSLCAALDLAGIPSYAGARLISILALLASLWSGWRMLRVLTANHADRVAGVLLAAVTANLLFWGTAGQVDMLAISFSLAAFASFLEWRESLISSKLWLAGLLVVLAAFTKQTAICAGAAIGLTLLWEDRRQAVRWIAAVAAAGAAIAGILQWVTHGAFLDNAVFANLNPFSAEKLGQQSKYFLLTAGGLVATVLSGLHRIHRRTMPLFLYTGLATVLWLLTAPKVGSDLNYQVEMTLLLAFTVGTVLDENGFFRAIVEQRRTWATMLQMPILLHVALNLALTVRNTRERLITEPMKTLEVEGLRPYLGPDRQRVLVAHYDALLQLRGRVEVETLIYTLLVNAGRTGGGPVLRDLEAKRFDTIVLPMDLTAATNPEWLNREVTPLPQAHLDAIRRDYRMVKHVDGPHLDGDYVYEPVR